ncbi:O-antigen ligase family protein [bacterium]|nr:O-antigen ligase family protein [bacterium]
MHTPSHTLLAPVDPFDRIGRWLAPAAILGMDLFCVFVYMKFASLTAVFGIIAFLLLVFLISFSARNSLIALFSLASMIPVYSWGSRYKFFRGISYHDILVYIFLSLIIVWALFDRLSGERRETGRWSAMEINLILFLVYVVLMMLRGLVQNGNGQIIYNETHHLLLYSFFFVYARLLSDRDIRVLLYSIPFITFIVSVEFMLLVASEGGFSSVFVKRIITQQPHLAQAAVPLLLATFLLPRKSIRLWALTALIPTAAMVFFCQQRGLWVGIFLATVLVVIFTVLKNRFTLLRVLKIISVLVLILALLVAILLVVDRLVTGSVFLTLFQRLFSLTTVGTDASMSIRMSEIGRALDQWDDNIITIVFGTGLGSEYETVDMSRTYGYSVDNSFAYLLWKTGLVGLMLFVFLYARAIVQGFSLLRLELPAEDRYVASALTAALIGLCFIAFTNACIVSYRFIMIWSLMICALNRIHTVHLSSRRS